MKLGEIVVHIGHYNFTKFHQNRIKNKKVLLIAHFSVKNFKVSVESWKLYMVGTGTQNMGFDFCVPAELWRNGLKES